MALISGRTLAAAAMIGVVAGVSGVAGAAVAGRTTADAGRAAKVPPLVLNACANKKSGAMSVIGAGTKKKRCKRTETAVRFAPTVLATDGSLRLTSPDGRFKLALSNNGVGMRGPGGSWIVDNFKTRRLDHAGKELP